MTLSRGRRRALTILIGLTILTGLIVGIAVGFGLAAIRNVRGITGVTEEESALPTVLYDRAGRSITELFGEEKRTLVEVNELPRHLIYALVTREDRAFFEHHGFNPGRTLAAAANNVLYYVSGGRIGYFSGASTITQQIAKFMYTNQEDTITRKIRELWWSFQLERHLSKYEILEEYLNRMPFGHGTYGVEAASRFYFGHGATELTLAESVLLVLQPSSPSTRKYSPLASPREARTMQRQMLDEMVELGYATSEKADASFAAYWANHDYTRSANAVAYLERLENDRAPWFSSHVTTELEELLLGTSNIYTDGFRVYTTLDLDYQKRAQERLWEGIAGANVVYKANQRISDRRISRLIPMLDALGLAFDVDDLLVGRDYAGTLARTAFRDDIAPIVDLVSVMFDNSEQDPLRQVTTAVYRERRRVAEQTSVQGALITIENETGHILAMVGGTPFATDNQTNRAVTAFRPPGSSFKPLYYSAAIDGEAISPATVFRDSPVAFETEEGWYMPSNYNGEWRGPTRARYALATSMNVVSLLVLDAVGFDAALSTAGRLLGLDDTQMVARGFEPRYPVGLGTAAVSPYLMARAFAAFPNGGREVIPVSIRFIEDRFGTTVVEPERDVAERLARMGRDAQVISPQAAYIMTDMLQSTVEYGTLRRRRQMVGGFDGMPMGGKTGTTDNWSDAWTVGFSPYMTTAVWLGFDRGGDNSLGTNQTGAQTAGPIWAQYMKEIHEGLPRKEFQRPPGIVEVTVAEASGLLPTEDYAGATIEELFIEGSSTIPTSFDKSQAFHAKRADLVARAGRLAGGMAIALDEPETGAEEQDSTERDEDGPAPNPLLD